MVKPRDPYAVAPLCAAVVALLLTVPGTAPAATSSAEPSFCQGTGPISTSTIGSGVNITQCPIVGRELETPDGTVPSLGVPVPGLDEGIVGSAFTTSGEYELYASVDAFGNLTVTKTSATPPAQPASVEPAAASDPACSESTYNLESGGVRWPASATVNWYYNESSVSRSGLSVSASLDDVRQANTNMTRGINNCGFAESVWNSRAQFIGDTSKYANIDSSAHCTSSFPDGQNTVSWGSLPSGYLAYTCYEHSSNTLTEADIQLASTGHLVDSLPSNCTDQSDLQSVATHEWGHAFGLAHETSGADEVMYPTGGPCRLRRHLGKGDYNGMAYNYGG